MSKIKTLTACTLVLTLLLVLTIYLPNPVLAGRTQETTTAAITPAMTAAIIPATTSAITSASTPASSPASTTALKLTLQQAAALALKNNLDLQLIAEDLQLRQLDQDKAVYYADLQRDADQKISDGWAEYQQKKSQFDQVKASLPTEIRAVKQAELDAAYTALQSAAQYEIDTLEEAQIAELIELKAKAGYEVTKAAQGLASKKVTLLTQKNYYDVLKAQRLVALKKAALERAQNQLKLARTSYQEGMRAKDDYLLAQCQVDLMRADLAKAQSTFSIAVNELLKVLNLPLQTELFLVDDFTLNPLQFDLKQDLPQGLAQRVEILKAKKELDVARVNQELTTRYSSPNTFASREAVLTVKKAELELAKQTAVAEAEIRGAAASLTATQAMLNSIQKTVQQAQESVKIATLRYQEGYGLPNSTLKGLHAEDASGTILEVLAAQEKLVEIEEKITEITYSHNLARSNYLISIGKEVTP